jgi:hypothetical protein
MSQLQKLIFVFLKQIKLFLKNMSKATIKKKKNLEKKVFTKMQKFLRKIHWF